MQRSGDRVRITAQLIRTASDRHIWAKAYDGDLKDVLSLQARVAEAITNQVKLEFERRGEWTPAPGTGREPRGFRSLSTWPLLLERKKRGGIPEGDRVFQPGHRKDPDFALASSGLADCHTLLTLYGDGVANMTEAQAAAKKALQLDGTLAEAHTSLAAVEILHDWDWQGAEQEFHRRWN